MTTTPTSGAAIQRYNIGYQSDDWGQRSSTPSGIPDASGSWVRYADHVAALAAGQATAAQAVVPGALDAIADSQYLAGVTAGFNAAQANDPNATLQKIHESRAGYLKPLRAKAAPAQPAAQQPEQGVAYAAGGLTENEWLQLADRHSTADWACDKPMGYLNAVRALCGDFASIRASHGQTPAHPEVSEHYRNAIAVACEGWTMPDGLRKHLEAALWNPPTPAPQADSVQEDAARWQYLRDERDVALCVMFFGNGCTNITMANVIEAIDAKIAARAAQKEGEKP